MRITWLPMYLLDFEGHIEKISNPLGDRTRRVDLVRQGSTSISISVAHMLVLQKRSRLGHYERPCPTTTPGRIKSRLLGQLEKTAQALRVLQVRHSPNLQKCPLASLGHLSSPKRMNNRLHLPGSTQFFLLCTSHLYPTLQL